MIGRGGQGGNGREKVYSVWALLDSVMSRESERDPKFEARLQDKNSFLDRKVKALREM